jgi:PBP1b-binding outer membrane lipoprotein LpoB
MKKKCRIIAVLLCSALLITAGCDKPTTPSQEPTPETRTEAYYQKRPCVEMVANAVRIYLTTLNNSIQD